MRCFRRANGTVVSLCGARYEPRKDIGAVQRQRFSDAGRAVVLLCVEYLFYEEAAGRRAGEFWRVFPRAGVGACSRIVGRSDLGDGNGVQSGGGEFYGSGYFVCDWAIGADGCCTLGSARLEGISRGETAGEDLSGSHVSLLSAGYIACGKSQHSNLTISCQTLVRLRRLAFMATQAQCEKAVTISEPLGRSLWRSEVTVGSKSPSPSASWLSGQRIPAGLLFMLSDTFFPVFNGLRDVTGLRSERFRNSLQYLQNRAFVLLRSGWFGPSFVTIMPTGVGVCSS